MPQFRKKPVVIEARQAVDDLASIVDIADWIIEGGGKASDPHAFYPNGAVLRIQTLEGVMDVTIGDWIIQGVQGEFYPCKPDIFAATYEPVGSDWQALARAAELSHTAPTVADVLAARLRDHLPESAE